MRVIAGIYRRRPLVAPAGIETRPTSDRLRETLFNVLANGAMDRIAGASFLDLYAGSGAVGIEAASRGAAAVTFVDENPAAIEAVKKNLKTLGLGGANICIEKRSAGRFLRGKLESPRAFDIVFLDPPYDQAGEYELALGLLGSECSGQMAAGAMVLAEHRRKTELAASYGSLVRTRLLLQGDVALSFYRLA